jgi:hypothetical protein
MMPQPLATFGGDSKPCAKRSSSDGNPVVSELDHHPGFHVIQIMTVEGPPAWAIGIESDANSAAR